MKRFKETVTSSRNIGYKKPESVSKPSGIFCEICGIKMIMDMYGIYNCSKCSPGISDSAVF